MLISKNYRSEALLSDEISFGVKNTLFPNAMRIMAEK